MKTDTLLILVALGAAYYFVTKKTAGSTAQLGINSTAGATTTTTPGGTQTISVDVPMFGSGVDRGSSYYETLGAIYTRMVELNRRYSTYVGADHPSGWNAWLIQAEPSIAGALPDPVAMFGSNDIWISPEEYWTKMGPWVGAHQSLSGLGWAA